MTTQREKALSHAIERLSGRDLSRFVDYIASNGTQSFNLNTHERYHLMRQVIGYASTHADENNEATP